VKGLPDFAREKVLNIRGNQSHKGKRLLDREEDETTKDIKRKKIGRLSLRRCSTYLETGSKGSTRRKTAKYNSKKGVKEDSRKTSIRYLNQKGEKRDG